MPAKDIFHESFVRALEKDGWTITDDPLTFRVMDTDLLIDIGAERLVGAERGNERIAVEIKSFVSKSSVQDLKEATGQFVLYAQALKRSPANADRTLLLAVRLPIYVALFENGIGKILLESDTLQLVVFDADREEINRWIPENIIGTS
jgi:hypothetical protein